MGHTMYREIVREMSGSERELLAGLVGESESRQPLSWYDGWQETLTGLAVWSLGLTACGALVVGAFLLLPNVVAPRGWELAGIIACSCVAAIFGLAGIICFYVMTQILDSHFHVIRLDKSLRRETVPAARAALADGRVKVKQVAATAVIELARIEDSSPGWLFDVGDGQTLLLMAPLYDLDDDSDDGDDEDEDEDDDACPDGAVDVNRANWPNSEFEIVRAHANNYWVGLFCHGQKLEPIRSIDQCDCKEEFACVEREELLSGDINAIAESMLQKAT